MATPRTRGGLVVRVDHELRFIPAAVALHVAPAPRVTTVPGAPRDLLGIALFSGVVVPVVAVAAARHEMVICQCGGELVGVVGLKVLEAGRFEALADRPDRVAFGGETASLLDVDAVYSSVHAASLARPRS